MQVSLGSGAYARVHQLVAEAFIGKCPPGQLVRHLNGDPSINADWNLAYGTSRQNYEDSIKHGVAKSGGDHHTAKLSDADVFEIRRLHEGGLSQVRISESFGVHRSTVSRIVRGVVR
jgi:hypothetical protein